MGFSEAVKGTWSTHAKYRFDVKNELLKTQIFTMEWKVTKVVLISEEE